MDIIAATSRAYPYYVVVEPDYRDLALEDAAFDLVWADERLRLLEADVAFYREFTNAAIDALHNLTVRYDRLRATHDQLEHDYRRYREDVLIRAGAI